MIKTRTFALDRTTASQLALRIALRQHGWIFIVLMVISAGAGAIFGGVNGILVVVFFWAAIGALVMLFFSNPLQRFRGGASGALRLHYEFSAKQFMIRTEKSGKSAKVAWESLTTASIIAEHYLLRDANSGFYTIPMNAFQKEEDRAQFESILHERGLMKGKNVFPEKPSANP